MTTPNIDTKALRERKQQPIERIRDAFARAHKIATGGLAHYMSIPADAERDADLILSDAIDELEALRNAAPALLDLAERAQGLERDVARADAIALTASKDANELEAERDALKAEVERLCKVHWQSVAAGIRSERDALRAKLSASEREAERRRADVAKVCDDWVHGDTHTTDWLLSRLMPIAQRGFALRGEEASRG